MTDQPRHNPDAVRAEILGDLALAAAAAEQRASVHRLWSSEPDQDRAAHWAEVARITALMRTSVAEHRLLDRLEADADADSYQDQYEIRCAWHTLQLYEGEDFFDGGLAELHQLFHPAQCRTLPPGAVCWAAHEPYQHWWPVDHGTYRIRAIQWVSGGTEDGPNIQSGMDIQLWDETTCIWADWNGTTRGEQEAAAAAAAPPEPAVQSPAAEAHPIGDFAIVELMGHVKLAGRITETTVAGAPVLRVDMLNLDGTVKTPKYCSPNSIYAITPCDEETARQVANPVSWHPAALASGHSTGPHAYSNGYDDVDDVDED